MRIAEQIQKERADAAPKDATVSTAELAKEAAEKAVLSHSDQVGAKFQGAAPSAPTYDLLREADQKIEKLHILFYALSGWKPISVRYARS
jgi:maltoporin